MWYVVAMVTYHAKSCSAQMARKSFTIRKLRHWKWRQSKCFHGLLLWVCYDIFVIQMYWCIKWSSGKFGFVLSPNVSCKNCDFLNWRIEVTNISYFRLRVIRIDTKTLISWICLVFFRFSVTVHPMTSHHQKLFIVGKMCYISQNDQGNNM